MWLPVSSEHDCHGPDGEQSRDDVEDDPGRDAPQQGEEGQDGEEDHHQGVDAAPDYPAQYQ